MPKKGEGAWRVWRFKGGLGKKEGDVFEGEGVDTPMHTIISLRKSTTGMILLYLLRVQDNNILPKWYEETTGLCFDCPEDDDLHIPSQPTCSHFYLWVKVPG